MVIQQEDNSAKKLVNSYRFKSASPHKYKFWKPDINEEERFKRKKQREDKYIAQFQPEDRPILLIKEKEAFLGLENKNVFDQYPDKEKYFKVSHNTCPVEDINQEIRQQDPFIKKQTIVHQIGQTLTEEQQNAMFKIEGIEFLPEGFLELDPLLYKDEYAFENKLHEKIFQEEQRKIKALRRKQYAQKNYQKMRDVTIYVLDEHKNRVIEYLERWHQKNNRKMKPEEISYVADILKCERQTLQDLEDMFLYKQKLLNTNKLRHYLMANGKLINNKLTVPQSFKQYFLEQNKSATRLNKKRGLKKNFSQNINYRAKSPKKERFAEGVFRKLDKINQNNNSYNKIFSKNLNSQKKQQEKKEKELKKQKSFDQLVQENLQKNQDVARKNPHLKKKQDLRIYYDSEINRILEKVKQSPQEYSVQSFNETRKKTSQSNQDDNQIPTSVDLLNSLAKDINTKYSQNQHRSYQIRKETKKRKSSQSSSKVDLEKLQKTKSIHRQKKNSKIDPVIEVIAQIDSFNPQHFKQSQKPKRLTTKLPRRVSLAYQNKKGDKYVIQKLGPILIGNKYYFQEIEDKTDQQGTRQVRVITRNNEGQIFKIDEISSDQIGKSYTHDIMTDQTSFINKNVIVSVKNEKGDTVSVQQIQPNKTSFIAVPKNRQSLSFNKSQIIREKQSTIHVLEPLEVFGDYYQQLVKEIMTEYGKEITIITKDNNGLILAKDSFFTKDQNKTTYFSYLEQELEDDKNKFQLKLQTKDENGELLASHCFSTKKLSINQKRVSMALANKIRSTTIKTSQEGKNKIRTYSLKPVFTGKDYFKQFVEEIEDEQGERKTCVITKNQNEEIVGIDRFGTELEGTNYVTEIIQDKLGDEVNREISLATKNEKGEIVNLRTVRPTIFSVLGENYFDQTIKSKKSRQTITFSHVIQDQSVLTHALRPTQIGNQYYQQIINEYMDNGRTSKLTLITKAKNGRTIAQTDLIPQNFDVRQCKSVLVLNKNELFIDTQDDKGNVLMSQLIRPDYVVELEGATKSDLNFKKKKSVVFQIPKNNKLKKFVLKPTLYDNEYYYQVIEQKSENNQIVVSIITKTQDGKIVSKCDVPQYKFKGKEFTLMFIENKDDTVNMKTQNELNQIIMEQNINKKLFEILHENQFDNFDKISKNKKNIITTKELPTSRITQYSLRPTKIGDVYYQQVIDDIIDGQGKRSVILTTKTPNGDIIALDELDENVSLNSEIRTTLIERKNQGQTILEIKNKENKKLASQTINVPKKVSKVQNKKSILKNSKLTQTSDKLINSFILRPTIIGDNYYNHVIQEIVDSEGNRKLSMITKGVQGDILNTTDLKSELAGENYHTEVLNDFVNSEGQRKLTIDVKNDRNQSLAQIKLKAAIELGDLDNYYFDNVNIKDTKRNESLNEKNRQFSVNIKKLRPTQIGTRNYNFYFVEKVDKDGNKRLTFVADNSDNQKILSRDVDPKLTGDNYQADIVDHVDENGEIISVVNFVNDKNQVVTTQKFKSSILNNIKDQLVDDEIRIMNSESQSTNSISTKAMKSGEIIKTIQIPPILVGDQYISQAIHEIKKDNKENFVLITRNENGEVLTKINIDPIEKENQNDIFLIEAIQEFINKNGDKVVEIETISEEGYIIANQEVIIENLNDKQMQILETQDNSFNKTENQVEQNQSNKFSHTIRKSSNPIVKKASKKLKVLQSTYKQN